MKHRAAPSFWQGYRKLPGDTQRLANDCYKLLRQDPRHPSLHFKRIGRLWSVRIGRRYRALAVEDGGDFVWFWIGSHAEYDAMLKKLN